MKILNRDASTIANPALPVGFDDPSSPWHVPDEFRDRYAQIGDTSVVESWQAQGVSLVERTSFAAVQLSALIAASEIPLPPYDPRVERREVESSERQHARYERERALEREYLVDGTAQRYAIHRAKLVGAHRAVKEAADAAEAAAMAEVARKRARATREREVAQKIAEVLVALEASTSRGRFAELIESEKRKVRAAWRLTEQ